MPKITDRALELGLYLPLGAYSRAVEGLSDLTATRVRKMVGEFVDRGEERTQAVTKVVRRRANKVEDVAETAAAKTQKQVRKTVKKASAATAPATAKMPRVAAPKTASELPIASYNSLTASEILTELKGLTQTQLAKVYKFEKANEGRATILEAIDSRLTPLPIATYDALTVEEINGRLDKLSESDLKTIRRYEADTKNRATVLDKIDTLL